MLMQVKVESFTFAQFEIKTKLKKVICVIIFFKICILKHGESSSLQRVYFKDLHVTKIIKGTDIQVKCIQFASSFKSKSRFFVCY